MEKEVFIPRKMFGKAKLVDIHRERSRIIVQPLDEADPIRKLGQNPVTLEISDASENTNAYLYSAKE